MAQVVTAQPGTTVVVQQTQVVRDWNSGVFACFDDIGSCKLTVLQVIQDYTFVNSITVFISYIHLIAETFSLKMQNTK